MARRRHRVGTYRPVSAGLKGGIRQPPKPPLPPAGSYNPDLDAARAAAGRGILDTRQDTELGLARAGQDYGFGVEDLNRGFGRTREDYTRNTQALQRSFNILAGQQAGQQRQMGVSGGGAVLQAAAKRKANQGIQQGTLDLGFKRATEDKDTAIGRLGVGYGRQVTDFGTGLSRAERENSQYGLDLNAQRMFQATQSGWEPPLPQAHPTSPHPTTRQRHRRTVGTVGRMTYGARF